MLTRFHIWVRSRDTYLSLTAQSLLSQVWPWLGRETRVISYKTNNCSYSLRTGLAKYGGLALTVSVGRGAQGTRSWALALGWVFGGGEQWAPSPSRRAVPSHPYRTNGVSPPGFGSHPWCADPEVKVGLIRVVISSGLLGLSSLRCKLNMRSVTSRFRPPDFSFIRL